MSDHKGDRIKRRNKLLLELSERRFKLGVCDRCGGSVVSPARLGPVDEYGRSEVLCERCSGTSKAS